MQAMAIKQVIRFQEFKAFCFYWISDRVIWPFTKRQILDSSKPKEYPGNDSEFEEDGGKLS